MCCFCPDCTAEILGAAARRPGRRLMMVSVAAALAGPTARPVQAQDTDDIGAGASLIPVDTGPR